jgi:hypothetical protein
VEVVEPVVVLDREQVAGVVAEHVAVLVQVSPEPAVDPDVAAPLDPDPVPEPVDMDVVVPPVVADLAPVSVAVDVNVAAVLDLAPGVLLRQDG